MGKARPATVEVAAGRMQERPHCGQPPTADASLLIAAANERAAAKNGLNPAEDM
jgi:hypothetical protein